MPIPASGDGLEGETLSTDFTFAFTHGSRTHDERGKELSIRVVQAGELLITSGSVVACDPYWLNTAPLEYATKVPLGRFPVFVSIAEFASPREERVACAKLRFNTLDVVRWEMAMLRGQDVSALEPEEEYCYGVDAGTGCFVDMAVVEWLFEQTGVSDLELWRGLPASMADRPGERATLIKAVSTYFETEVDARLYATWPSSYPPLYAEVILNDETGGNLVLFTSGWGDGCYVSYFGYAADGSLACLVTDFDVLPGTHPKGSER